MKSPTLDIAANRRARNYTKGEMFRRVLWGAGRYLIRFSPRPCFGWRRFVLRRFGAKIGANVNMYASTRIYFPWNLTVGDLECAGRRSIHLQPRARHNRRKSDHLTPGATLCRYPRLRAAGPAVDQAANRHPGSGVDLRGRVCRTGRNRWRGRDCGRPLCGDEECRTLGDHDREPGAVHQKAGLERNLSPDRPQHGKENPRWKLTH